MSAAGTVRRSPASTSKRCSKLGRKLVEEKPLTFTALGKLLQKHWPGRPADSLGYAVRNHLAMVQVPPRGLWGKSGQPAHTTIETWLGRSVDAETSPDEMILRYIAAFGPASVRDAQVWSGLPKLADVVRAAAAAACDLPRRGGPRALRSPKSAAPRCRIRGAGALPAGIRQRPSFACRPHAHRQRRGSQMPLRRRRRADLDHSGRRLRAWRVEDSSARASPRRWRSSRTGRSRRRTWRRSPPRAERLLAFAAPEAKHEVRFANRLNAVRTAASAETSGRFARIETAWQSTEAR